MPKIGVIGSHETVMGFRALGLDTFAAATAEEAKKILRDVTGGESDYAILYLEETFAAEMEREIAKFKDRPTPAIILIPGRDGSNGMGMSALQSAVERAVGSDIFNNGTKGK